MVGLSIAIVKCRSLARINDRGPNDFFIDLYMMSKVLASLRHFVEAETPRYRRQALRNLYSWDIMNANNQRLTTFNTRGPKSLLP